jgi:hypothetical protein
MSYLSFASLDSLLKKAMGCSNPSSFFCNKMATMVSVGSRPKWERRHAKRRMTAGREIVEKKVFMKKNDSWKRNRGKESVREESDN